ncbi:Retrovirus-related Pol polyprotein from transposon TNT 1-94 [Apostasia shenzhenica]|uniref:Retrovirus-related Pol polyprotein from transposon TNT 1-94 n=1 Tax=Apostasia shenzhenica TaxID=1088818 RepID=A0A2I0AQG2_9ASPA|nr:Retrovirus-related Pol polyprotein from transposon TNT 1-94 [Apostasia shenzhenica]
MKKQLYSLHISEETDLLEYMNIFNKMISQLYSIEVKLEEEDEALFLLSSLAKFYDHLVKTLKMEKVNAILLLKKVRNKQSTDESLTANGNQDKGRSKSKFSK